jgi:glycosyltransferase involved in cell wall biosynthesis
MANRACAGSLICFSHLRWDFVYQRPQHLMSRAAKGRQVVFFEEPVLEAGAAPSLLTRRDASGVLVATPLLPLSASESEKVSLQRGFVDLLVAGMNTSQAVFWYYTPMALPFTRHIAEPICIYDNMDELSAFKGASPHLLSLEEELFDRADVVFTGGQSLYRAKRHRHPNIHAFPSSIDAHHFRSARNVAAEPRDQSVLPRPRLGFFGVIDERLDISLLAELADLRPEWQIVMIGPVVKIDPNSLPHRRNIAWLGIKPYEDLPAYLSGWDVGIMPFAQNEATRFISPTKTPEFLAAGVRVVSTPIRDVVDPYGKAGLVAIAATAKGFVRACEKIMNDPKRPWLIAVDRKLKENSWDLTWEKMESFLTRARPAANRGETAPLTLHV